MNKRLVTGIIAGVILVATAVGSTLAFFSQQTETKKNVFTMGNAIIGELKEPAWDHDSFTGEEPPIEEAGQEMAKNFIPDMTIPKNPMIKNTSSIANGKKADAWVAIRLDYKKSDVASDFKNLDKFIDIAFNKEDWIISEDFTKAYYKWQLAANEKTTPLFHNVHIDELAISAEQLENGSYNQSYYTDLEVEDYVISDFEIIATGYLVQTSGFNDAQEAMFAAFHDKFS